MAITRIQHVVSSSTTATISASGSGNLIVVFILATVGVGITASDNVGNTYTQLSIVNNAAQYLWTFYAKNTISGATLISTSGSVEGLFAIEYSGVDTVSPIDTSNTLSDTNPPIGPSLTNSNSGSVLVTAINALNAGHAITGANSPWTFLDQVFTGAATADYFPGTTGTFNTVFLPTSSVPFSSSGVAFKPPTPALTLNLFDSIASSDTTVKEDDKATLTESITPSDALAIARAQNVSDSTTVTDAFALRSDFLAPVAIPVVETLVERLIPATVKVYFKIEE